jgi:molybdate transport system ATP-binding protein
LVAGEHELLADVTPAAVAELRLSPGSRVWLSVKETAVRGYSAEPGLPDRAAGPAATDRLTP